MTKYYVVGYINEGEIIFYRITSVKRLNEKTTELNKSGALYNTLIVTGINITFNGGS